MKIKRFDIINFIFSEHTLIAWMMAVAIIPMLLLSYFSYTRAEHTLEHAISTTLLTEIQKKVDEIDANISAKKLNLLQFSELPELAATVNGAVKEGHLERIEFDKMKEFVNYLDFITPKIGVKNLYIISMEAKVVYALHHGKIVGHVLSQGNAQDANLYNAFYGAKMLRMPYVYTAFKGAATKGLTIYLSNIIHATHLTTATLILELDPFEIEKVIQLNFGYTKSDQTLLGMLINSQPAIVISTNHEKESAQDSPYLNAINGLLRQAISGDMALRPTEIWQNGVPTLAISSYVPQLNMGMIIQYDKTEVYQKIHWLKINIIALTLIDLLTVIMIVLWIASSLREAHQKSERLLENILPKFVVKELKEKKQFLARHVYNVSIVFIDIMNFTPFFSSKPPEEVVIMLDQLFSIFDGLCDKYQIEKIKTIGDAYMAVSGLIVPHNDHASKAVDMGLDAIEAVSQYNLAYNTEFSIRVGIDSGDVIAGIIGKKKFSYDLWGRSVNCSSRMEASGLSNEVQISMSTYNAMLNKENFQFKLRKDMLIKGFGKMNTYLVSRI